MKRLVLVIPLLAVSAFAGYYHYWNSTAQKEMIGCTLPRLEEPYGEYRHRNARRDADDDFMHGHPRILTFGLPAPWTHEYGEILRRDYGVELETVAGCVVSTPLVDYVTAYNETIEGYLASVHGPDLFEKAHAEARALYNERHKR
jgi:hypothetical protein